MIEALKSLTPIVRQHGALALGNIGPEANAAVAALTGCLGDKDWQVRRQAAVALGQIGPEAKSAAAALQKLTADPNSVVRKAPQESIRKLQP